MICMVCIHIHVIHVGTFVDRRFFIKITRELQGGKNQMKFFTRGTSKKDKSLTAQ